MTLFFRRDAAETISEVIFTEAAPLFIVYVTASPPSGVAKMPQELAAKGTGNATPRTGPRRT